ncbi:hypothetical protein PHAMO_190027 [Magnetospirillum molischianum DSM 120]|uniref:Uncharacterized protein n=1 Tax=Magnetospirillum molischianum DSM 120 TaxID=1150626 RepID=H8FPD0_MAGML|nr:hypothetical protein PHAMO_190027 [Magnetospirillum molischianum DSM 120]
MDRGLKAAVQQARLKNHRRHQQRRQRAFRHWMAAMRDAAPPPKRRLGAAKGIATEALSAPCPLVRQIDSVILDHCVGEQAAAHGLDRFAGFGGIGFIDVEFDQLALADVVDAEKAERGQRVLDGLALGIEDTGLEGYEDFGFHVWVIRLLEQGGKEGRGAIGSPPLAPVTALSGGP